MSRYLMGIALYALTLPIQAAPVLYENFAVKPKWKAFYYADPASPAFPSASAVNGEMRVSIPYNSSGVFAAGYTTTCLFTGDFDISVDYKLLSFPAQSGVRVALTANDSVKRDSSSVISASNQAKVIRMSGAVTERIIAGENYATNISGDCCHPIPTAARTGKLRMVRSGGIVTGYYFDAYQDFWVEINNGGNQVSFGDTRIELAVYSYDSLFSDKNILVSFDNFFISKGTLTGSECPTPQAIY